MATVSEVIHRLLPSGSAPGRRPSWRQPPFWPPDLFAVCGTLASLSGCYSRPRYTSLWDGRCLFNSDYIQSVRRGGNDWSDRGTLTRDVRRLWDRLMAAGDEDVLDPDADWCDSAMTLLTIADEASAGMGFVNQGPRTERSGLVFADYLLELHRTEMLRRPSRRYGPKVPVSLCWMVPPSEVCVQPKARTPQVGCTLRSLTHHLCLLPPQGEISTSWLFAPHDRLGSARTVNLLLVPYPYRIDGNCFVGWDERYGEGESRFFSVRPNWLYPRGRRLSPSAFAEFLIPLVTAAARDVSEVHGVVLPECALEGDHAKAVAKILAARTGLEIFICGTVGRSRSRDDFVYNRVYTSIFHQHRIIADWDQAKHHRWKLDDSQIRRYHLGDSLDPRYEWWERVELQPRKCTFYVFRGGASLASLVCEDLARIDPVQVALRAIGPNLVVVLLMDGPQLERRWPGRYATVLADDPGSAVLTLTCQGMVRRSVMPGEPEPRQIALWKDATGPAKELTLPRDAHALLLTLTQAEERNHCLDGRSDGGTTIGLSLTGVHGVRHPRAPAWID
jgi:hypothetical protein